MGFMDNGTWVTDEPKGRISNGRYNRPETQFRGVVAPDSADGFAPEAGRYHLFVAHACPWAHRTLIVRALLGLEAAIDVSFVKPLMLENGWALFEPSKVVDGALYMHHVYGAARSDYTGRCSVPVLWDTQTNTIVSNESADIVRMLNAGFRQLATRECPDLYPRHLRSKIDKVNELVYHQINNGVYKCGFAVTQAAYEESFYQLFDALDQVEATLATSRYLCGNEITEADWRLFATLIRFDAVYVGHFKCNRNRIEDFPNLSHYTRELYQWPGVAETFDLDLTKEHYYGSHESVNPKRIVPVGPTLDFTRAHDRERLG